MRYLENFRKRKIVILHENDSASMASKTMHARRIGCVLVVNRDGGLCGMVTDRDLVDAVLARDLGPNTRLKEIMSREVAWVQESSSVPEVISVMKKFGVRRVPVVRTVRSGQRRCVGLITLDDLIAAEAVTVQDLSAIVKAQVLKRNGAHSSESWPKDLFMKELSGHFYNSVEELEAFAAMVFEALFRRLHYSSAVNFMLQLPSEFQRQLIPLPPGPERTISAEYLRDATARILSVPKNAVPGALEKLWLSLGKFADVQELSQIMAELPEDIQSLFMCAAYPMRMSEMSG